MMSNNLPIASPIRTEAIINRYLTKAKKNLGQNFLVDPLVVQKIIAAASIEPGDQVIEVGPGIGSLTEQLLLAGAKVLAYELDQDLVPILENELPQKIGDLPRQAVFKLLLKDILKADFKADSAGFLDLTKPVKVVANLPYYITTPIIFAFLQSKLDFQSLTLMVQKEVGDRLAAKPKSKAYGPLSLAVQSRLQVRQAVHVLATSFRPKPKVDSAVMVLKPLLKPFPIKDLAQFDHVVKLAFSQRRKTLNNNLKPLIHDQAKRLKLLTTLGLTSFTRPEELTMSQFIALADHLSANY